MRTEIVHDWSDFMRLTSEFDGWAFRGQQNAAWPLESSLSRYLTAFVPDRDQWSSREGRAVRIFRRKAHNYLQDIRALSDDLRCLGLMQHHGAPTRLLDFTKSPFVAAFFALERSVENSAVFALNTPALWLDSAVPAIAPHLTRDEIDPRRAGNFEKYFLADTNPIVWFGEPAEMDQRLIAQSGTLVIPGQVQQPLDRILDQYVGKDELLIKIVLSAAVREEGMRTLYRMNITNASLFPDLEGLARSIALELEMVWPK